MISIILGKARSSLVLRNSISLFLLQIGGYLVPLVVTPYLTRSLGVEAFGAYALALSVAAYFSVIVDWGFPLSGPRDASISRNNPEKLRRLFWSVTYARGLLALASLAIFCLIAPVWGLQNHFWLCFFAGLQVVALVCSAGWFLSGLENMAKPGIYGLIARVLTVPATLLLVHSAHDLVVAVAIQSAGALAGAAVSIWYAHRDANVIRKPIFSLRAALEELKQSRLLFVSMGAMSLFTYANVIVLGAMAGLRPAAVFNGGHRIMRAGQQMLSPLSSAFYPRINHQMAHDMAGARRSMRTLFIAQVAAGGVASIGIALFAPWVVAILLGPEFSASVPVLQILCGTMFVSSISNSLGTNMLLPMGLKSSFAAILVISGFLNVLLLVLLIPVAGPIGAALATLVTECVTAGGKGIMVYRNRARLRPAAPT